ncbi:sugar ABC transporter permease [Microbacterium sp. X-17]|uniref:carbohydrate ABC transporter permease n=1 Tax=Microbacterium sp. X-17 TaxID=3144404 RepID=UPI0031F58BEB
MTSVTATKTQRPQRPQRQAVPSRIRRALPGGLYLGLAIVLSAILFSYPAISTVITSFSVTAANGATAFGFDNYVHLFNDSVFYTTLLNTFVYAVIFVVGTIVLGTLLALALYSRIPGHGAWRFIILAPSFLPIAFIGVVWAIGLDPSVGWLQSILKSINPALNQAWLADPNVVMPLIAVIAVIQGAGWPMAIIWTSLQDVPPEIIEAGTVDGASSLQRTRFILLPYVRETIATVTLLQIIFSLKVFDMPWVMTRGGPSHASETLTIFVYNQAFVNQNFPLGCAAAVVSCILIVIVTLGYQLISRRKANS